MSDTYCVAFCNSGQHHSPVHLWKVVQWLPPREEGQEFGVIAVVPSLEGVSVKTIYFPLPSSIDELGELRFCYGLVRAREPDGYPVISEETRSTVVKWAKDQCRLRSIRRKNAA